MDGEGVVGGVLDRGVGGGKGEWWMKEGGSRVCVCVGGGGGNLSEIFLK